MLNYACKVVPDVVVEVHISLAQDGEKHRTNACNDRSHEGLNSVN